MKETCIFLLAGEPSADPYGSLLIDHLKEQIPYSTFYGIGGAHMQCSGLKPLLPFEPFHVMGLSDVFWKLPSLFQTFRIIKQWIVSHHPDLVILIDYPGFNLRLAKAIRADGYKGKIVHYIAPSVWAHGAHRIHTLEKNVDLLLCILPFEKAYFKNTSLCVEYIGHPLIELIEKAHSRKQRDPPTFAKKHLLSLFPGSRPGEIKANLPLELEAARYILSQDPTWDLAICSSNLTIEKEIHKHLKQSGLISKVHVVSSQYRYELMNHSTIALAKSGTITLELALNQVPSVVLYQLSMLNKLFAQHILRLNLKHYCLVNILAEKEIFPEFIDRHYTAQDLGKALYQLAQDHTQWIQCKETCQKIYNMLSQWPCPSARAAALIQSLL